MSIFKSQDELKIMDRANRIVLDVLDRLSMELRPGVVLKDLDAMAEGWTRGYGALPAFKGYRNYPASVCISLNDEVVHGIPNGRRLKQGDLVSLDFGVIFEGFYGDAARTFTVGEADEGAKRLIDLTREALHRGVEQAREGNRVQDISCAVQGFVEAGGYSVVRDFTGHGIGRKLHEEPQVPNFGKAGLGPKLQAGMVLAIEPMVNEGGYEVTLDADGWTVRTRDGKRSAHFEYSVAVTPAGPWILGMDSR